MVENRAQMRDEEELDDVDPQRRLSPFQHPVLKATIIIIINNNNNNNDNDNNNNKQTTTTTTTTTTTIIQINSQHPVLKARIDNTDNN